MKRMSNFKEKKISKKHAISNDEIALPSEIWLHISDYLDKKSIGTLCATTRFFATDNTLKELLYKKEIQAYFDYNDEIELSDSLIKTGSMLNKYRNFIEILYQNFEENKNIKYSNCREDEEKLTEQIFNLIRDGHIYTLKFLLDTYPWWNINQKNEEDENMTALGHAALAGRRHIFSYLLEKGATFVVGEIGQPYHDSHLIYSDMSGYGTIQPLTPLHIIALKDELWFMQLLNQYVNVQFIFSAQYYQFLCLIIVNDSSRLKELLALNNSVLLEYDVASWHLLHWAACLDKPDCITVLIEHNVDVNLKVSFRELDALYVACAAGKINAMQTLVKYGIEINPVDEDKNICLHLTAHHGYIDCTTYLIEELKQDVNAVNDYGETPLSLAILNQQNECIELLKKHGAHNVASSEPK